MKFCLYQDKFVFRYILGGMYVCIYLIERGFVMATSGRARSEKRELGDARFPYVPVESSRIREKL